MTESRSQFTYKFLAALCDSISVKTLATKRYNLQAELQAHYFNETTVSKLPYCVAEHHMILDFSSSL